MIHLAWPWMALVLPLPYLWRRWRQAVAPAGVAVFMPFAAQLAGDVAARDSSRWRAACYALIWGLLVLAAMRPQWLGEPLPVPTTGRNLLLAVDVSGSMQTPDMAQGMSRLAVVQKVAGDFIEARHGDQLGLILFGTQPYLQAPLSPDLQTIHQFLDEARIGIAGPETAIGDAIGMALKKLQTDPDKERHTVLILLTDGQSNAGEMPPLEAAKMAAQTGLRIYTIGVGAQSGIFSMGGNNDLDEESLQQIASITGGAYFRAANAGALQDVYAQIDKLEPVDGKAQWLRPADDWFPWPLGLALFLSLPAVFAGVRRWG
jgi:Ca-activated chloride channel family protein